jgi:large subunit ribosomal protein L16
MLQKTRKGRIRGVKFFNELPHLYSHKLVLTEAGRLTTNQIEAARRIISKQVKRVGTYKIHVRASTSVSTKPSEVRMGKGKGAIDYYIARVKAGQLLFTIRGLNSIESYRTFLRASRKLPLKIKIITASGVID